MQVQYQIVYNTIHLQYITRQDAKLDTITIVYTIGYTLYIHLPTPTPNLQYITRQDAKLELDRLILKSSTSI